MAMYTVYTSQLFIITFQESKHGKGKEGRWFNSFL